MMKKNIFTAAFVAAIGIFAGYNVHNAQKTEAMSDITLANVEALANTEVEVRPWYCVVDWHICHIFGPGDTLDGIKYKGMPMTSVDYIHSRE